MNAAQENTICPAPSTPGEDALRPLLGQAHEPDVHASGLSALVDGEIAADELDGVLAEYRLRGELRAAWHTYQVIGDVLRASAPALSVQAPQAFLAGIHARLQAETVSLAPSSPPLEAVPAPVPVLAGHARALAANDAVFRWKLVAGLASLAAVMAVGWTVLGSAPGGNGIGAQLALMGPPSAPGGTAAVEALAPAANPVLVNTAQGPVIRDAGLEALLAEHRQYGGMSALQMPAGFLRNATYDAPER